MGICWLVMMSVTLIESDAYRYAALSVIIIFVFFLPKEDNANLIDWLAVLCVACGSIALFRFLSQLIMTGEKGASEWLYAFPLLFPLLGRALYGSRSTLRVVLACFFCVALLLLLISTDFARALTGERIFPLFHQNPIHGAVGCGFLVIGAFYWASHHYEMGSTRAVRTAVTSIAMLVIAIALFNIWGSKSKGVWLALIPTFLLIVSSAFLFLRKKEVLVSLVAGVLLLGSGVFLAHQNILAVVGPTAKTVVTLYDDFMGGRSVSSILGDAIASPETPFSVDERLQLWSNASEIIAASPIFGSGNHWLAIWHKTHYAGIPYTLMHNGYLEVLVRHGFVGLAIYGLIFVASIYRVFRASKQGLLSKSAFLCYFVCAVYFACTILSNSNNRLALGESYVLLFSAVCFACTISMKMARPDVESTPQSGATVVQASMDHQRQTYA